MSTSTPSLPPVGKVSDSDKEKTTEDEDSDSGSEYEECLVYVETDDIRAAEDLFENDDKRRREAGDEPRHPREIELTFHKLDTEEPIMEVEGMLFSGRVEDPPGTGLLFAPSSSGLPKLTSDLSPPIDPVFGVHPPANSKEYQLVYKADKIIRMKRIHAQMETDLDYGYIRTFEDTSEEEKDEEEIDDDDDANVKPLSPPTSQSQPSPSANKS